MAAGLKLGMHNMHVATAITIIEVFHHNEVKVGNIFITSCSIDLVWGDRFWLAIRRWFK